jgi:hypothetical protein
VLLTDSILACIPELDRLLELKRHLIAEEIQLTCIVVDEADTDQCPKGFGYVPAVDEVISIIETLGGRIWFSDQCPSMMADTTGVVAYEPHEQQNTADIFMNQNENIYVSLVKGLTFEKYASTLASRRSIDTRKSSIHYKDYQVHFGLVDLINLRCKEGFHFQNIESTPPKTLGKLDRVSISLCLSFGSCVFIEYRIRTSPDACQDLSAFCGDRPKSLRVGIYIWANDDMMQPFFQFMKVRPTKKSVSTESNTPLYKILSSVKSVLKTVVEIDDKINYLVSCMGPSLVSFNGPTDVPKQIEGELDAFWRTFQKLKEDPIAPPLFLDHWIIALLFEMEADRLNVEKAILDHSAFQISPTSCVSLDFQNCNNDSSRYLKGFCYIGMISVTPSLFLIDGRVYGRCSNSDFYDNILELLEPFKNNICHRPITIMLQGSYEKSSELPSMASASSAFDSEIVLRNYLSEFHFVWPVAPSSININCHDQVKDTYMALVSQRSKEGYRKVIIDDRKTVLYSETYNVGYVIQINADYESNQIRCSHHLEKGLKSAPVGLRNAIRNDLLVDYMVSKRIYTWNFLHTAARPNLCQLDDMNQCDFSTLIPGSRVTSLCEHFVGSSLFSYGGSLSITIPTESTQLHEDNMGLLYYFIARELSLIAPCTFPPLLQSTRWNDALKQIVTDVPSTPLLTDTLVFVRIHTESTLQWIVIPNIKAFGAMTAGKQQILPVNVFETTYDEMWHHISATFDKETVSSNPPMPWLVQTTKGILVRARIQALFASISLNQLQPSSKDFEYILSQCRSVSIEIDVTKMFAVLARTNLRYGIHSYTKAYR